MINTNIIFMNQAYPIYYCFLALLKHLTSGNSNMQNTMTRRGMLTSGGILTAGALTSLFPSFDNAEAQAMSKSANEKDKRRRELYSLLGDLPDRDRPVSAKTVLTERTGDYILEKLVLDLNGFEPVPAYFVRPLDTTGKTPVVIFNHAHFGEYHVGKSEFINGRAEYQAPPHAAALARQGYSALCIDAWGFGERMGRTESEIFKEMLWNGQVMWGMMVYDSIKAVDYLETRGDVDLSRLAAMGMSMGSTMSWWLSALDPRVSVCIDINCLTDYQAIIKSQGLDEHGIYYYVPSLLKHFTTSQINALISPRPHLGLAGRYDRLTPLDGLHRIDRELKEVYKADGVPEKWKLSIYDIGHFETAAMRKEIMAYLAKWL